MIHTTFTHEGSNYRLANQAEIDSRRDSGQNGLLACTNCGKAAWMCKGLALNSNGGYNSARNIFWLPYDSAECQCLATHLRAIECA